jgi:hypothetical protein
MTIFITGIINPFDSAEVLRETAHMPHISVNTLRCRLGDDGINGRRPAKKVFDCCAEGGTVAFRIRAHSLHN